MKRRSLAVATCLALIGWYGLARAEEPAAAQAAFDDGKRLVEEGRLERACAKFAESQRLDPAGGTLLHLADCYDRAEKTASAFHTYGAALAQARKDGRGDREQAAKDRLERLGPRMSLIRIDVPSTSRVPGLEVRRNNTLLSDRNYAVATPVDPGRYSIRAEAPGHHSWEKVLTIRAPGTVSVAVPLLKSMVQRRTNRAESLPQRVARPPDVVPTRHHDPFGTQRTLAVGAAAVGVVALGVGTYFGLQSMGKKSEADSECDGSRCRSQDGVDAREAAIGAGNWSTLGFAAGGVGVAVAATLWFTAPEASALSTAAQLSGSGARVRLEGRF